MKKNVLYPCIQLKKPSRLQLKEYMNSWTNQLLIFIFIFPNLKYCCIISIYLSIYLYIYKLWALKVAAPQALHVRGLLRANERQRLMCLNPSAWILNWCKDIVNYLFKTTSLEIVYLSLSLSLYIYIYIYIYIYEFVDYDQFQILAIVRKYLFHISRLEDLRMAQG